jgi:precorrin-6x reductase
LRTDTFEIDASAIGGNASQEGGEDEGVEAASKQGVDIVMNARLVEYTISKKDYMTHIKGYMAR